MSHTQKRKQLQKPIKQRKHYNELIDIKAKYMQILRTGQPSAQVANGVSFTTDWPKRGVSFKTVACRDIAQHDVTRVLKTNHRVYWDHHEEFITFSPLRDTISRGPYMNLAVRTWSRPSRVTKSLALWLAFRFCQGIKMDNMYF